MSFDEAVALLGLTSPLTSKDVRRAYLRLLKVHKPETDPQGFMRLREAYELLCALDGGAHSSEPGPVVVRLTEGDARPAASEASSPEPEGERSDGTVESEALLAGVDERELLPWERDVPEDPKAAAAQLCEWLERSRSDASAPPPPVNAALRVLWSMLERRAFKTAGRLYRAIDGWLLHVGGARGQLAWGMTQGLWEMRKVIPSNLYPPMVRGVATARPAAAANALRHHASEWPVRAQALHGRLFADAPQLEAVFGKYLVPPRTENREVAPAGGGLWRAAWLIVPLLFAMRACPGAKTTGAPAAARPGAVADSALDELQREAVSEARALEVAAVRHKQEMVEAHARNVEAAISRRDCAGAHEEFAACATHIMVPGDDRDSLLPLLWDLETAVSALCGPPPEVAVPRPDSSTP